VAVDPRGGPGDRRDLRVLRHVGTKQTLLGHDAGVLAVLGDDDRLRVVLLEYRPNVAQPAVDVDLEVIARCYLRDIHVRNWAANGLEA